MQKIATTDCDYLAKAIQFMGDDIKQDYASITNCCQFRGIVCDSHQRITEIHLKNFKDYSVDINSAIGELEKLRYLTTFEMTNVITATDDSLTSKIGNLKNLKTLIIKDNYIDFLETKLPKEIGNLINLEVLDLSNNNFNGPIPKSIGKLENLKVLNLKGNSFEGTIPYEFKNLNNLEDFNINGNTKLYGYVPLLPKVTVCDYGVTELCSIKSSKCKSSLIDCTKEEVIKTNMSNGNPNKSDESQFEEIKKITNKKDDSGIKINDTSMATLSILVMILCIIMCILLCKCRKHKHEKYSDSENDDENQNNDIGNTPNTNINVNINANISPYSGPVQTVDITDTNCPVSGFVDITTPYDNELTPYTSAATSPTPVSPPNNYTESNNNLLSPPQQTNDQNYISPPNPSTYNGNSMLEGPANGFVDISTPYDSALTPYSSSNNSSNNSPTPASPNNDNYYITPNSPQNNYEQNPIQNFGFVPPPMAYPPLNNINK